MLSKLLKNRSLNTIIGCLPVVGLTHDLDKINHDHDNEINKITVKSSFTEIKANFSRINSNGQYKGLIYNTLIDPYEQDIIDYNMCAIVRKRHSVLYYYVLVLVLDLERSLNKKIMFNYIETEKEYKVLKTDIFLKYHEDKDIEQLLILNSNRWIPRN